MEIMIRIIKGKKSIQVTQANWDRGWFKASGWVIDQPEAPPKVETEEESVNITIEPDIDYMELTKKELTQKIIDGGGEKPKPQLNKTALIEILNKQ